MRSSQLIGDLYVSSLEEVEAQSMKWLQNLQLGRVVTQGFRHQLQKLNFSDIVQLSHGFSVMVFHICKV